MALINCPECKKNVSSLAEFCPNCGCPISSLKKSENISAEEIPHEESVILSNKNIPKNKRIIKLCVILGLSFILILGIVLVLFLVNRQTYSYKENGLFGLPAPIRWEMYKPDVESLKLGDNDSSRDDYLDYHVQVFGCVGSLSIRFTNNGTGAIDKVFFTTHDYTSPEDISKTISELLGEPIHFENFNNKKQDKCAHVWLYDKQHFLILMKGKQWDSVELEWRTADPELIDKAKKTLKDVEKDTDYYESYLKLLDRESLLNGSIVDVIDSFGVTEYEIVEGNQNSNALVSVGIGDYSYESVDYIENIELFGYNARIKYHCRNPYDDDYPDFIGQIESISYQFIDTISSDQAELLSNRINQYRDVINEVEVCYLPIRIEYNPEHPQHISCRIIEDYYLINPEYGNDRSVSVEEYKDCDPEILHVDVDNSMHAINKESDAGNECWKLVKSNAPKYLKYPDSVEFNDDYVMMRQGNNYYVHGSLWVSNTVGMKVKRDYVALIKRDGYSYSFIKAEFDTNSLKGEAKLP